jgi:hypothetical protein
MIPKMVWNQPQKRGRSVTTMDMDNMIPWGRHRKRCGKAMVSFGKSSIVAGGNVRVVLVVFHIEVLVYPLVN